MRFVLQRINKSVFRDPAALMDNVQRVTVHLRERNSTGLHSLTLVPTVDGDHFRVDDSGEYWRMFRFIEGATSFDTVPSPAHAREAARQFGRFQAMLADLPGPRLRETIPHFHDTPFRYATFHEARERDVQHRSKHCMPEIDWALAREDCAALLSRLHEAGEIPERITHNDTKINNVLFDVESGKAICVIDLDTVMPGLAPHDFGDLVRTATSPAAEDETELQKIEMRMDYFEALVDGYLGATAGYLTEAEVESLALAGKIITIETGLRFLTDYLSGDSYFRVDSPEQNLQRCRAQFALADSIDKQLAEMQRVTSDAYHRLQ